MKKRKKGLYICVEGLDGTGKTTLVQSLKTVLEEAGLEVDTVSPTKLSDANHFLEKAFKKSMFLNNNRLLRSVLYAHRSNYAARKTDWNKTVILGDRSIVISYVVRWGKTRFKKFLCKRMVNNMERQNYAPDHIIFLDASYDTLQNRMDCRNRRRDIDESLERLVEMKVAYDEIMLKKAVRRLKNTRWHIISAENSIDEVSKQSFDLILRLLEEQSSLILKEGELTI